MTLTVRNTQDDFATVLKRLRVASGLSQEALAERAAISAQAVSALETGLRKSPYPKTIALLADALRLDEHARAQLVEAAAAGKTAREAAADATSSNGKLPQRLGAIIGRDNEAGAIESIVAANRLVTVLGPGGIGKTTVALEAARRIAVRYADGAYFCDLSGLRDGAMVASAVAAARGVRTRSDADPAAALSAALRSSNMLLVLDNCEHLVEDASTIAAELLKACPNVSILATSRRPLGVPSEVTHRPPPLATPTDADDIRLTAQSGQQFSAIALFVERARAINPSFVLSDDNVAAVANICRSLDGIALAIELAAAQLRIMTVHELEQRLGQRFRLLRDSRHADAPRQRTLAAAFDWSYSLLTPTEQRFFRALGIFAGNFSLDAALEICCESDADELYALELLAALVDASLVVADSQRTATSYRLLETTRAYAAEKVTENDERAALAARHLEYYRAHASEVDLISELEDVRAALRWALGGGDVSAGAELAATVGVQWEKLGLTGEGIARLVDFISAANENDAALLARLWVALSFLEGNALSFDRAFAAATTAIRFARRGDDDAILFNALRSQATFAAWNGSFDEARVALGELATVAERIPTPLRRLHLLAARGHLGRMSHDYETAIPAFEEARAVARSLGDDYREVSATVHISEAEHERGNTRRSVQLMRELRGRGLSQVDAEPVLANLTGYLIALDDVNGAREAARELLTMPIAVSKSTFINACLEHVALADALTGHLARASRLFGYANAWYSTIGQARQFTEQHSHDRLNALLTKALPPPERDELMAEGASFTAERAVREALLGLAGD